MGRLTPSHAGHILSARLITLDVGLLHLAKLEFVRFFHSAVTLFPSLPDGSFWGEVAVCSPYLRSGDVCSHSLWAGHLHKVSRILLQGRFVSSPPSPCHLLLYSVIYLYQCGRVDISFILWVITQYHFIYFVAPIRDSLNWLQCLVEILPSLAGCVFIFVFVSFFVCCLPLSSTPLLSHTHPTRPACCCDLWCHSGISFSFMKNHTETVRSVGEFTLI